MGWCPPAGGVSEFKLQADATPNELQHRREGQQRGRAPVPKRGNAGRHERDAPGNGERQGHNEDQGNVKAEDSRTREGQEQETLIAYIFYQGKEGIVTFHMGKDGSRFRTSLSPATGALGAP
jgi:hypothetical protein